MKDNEDSDEGAANEELTRVNDDEVAENKNEENKQDGKQWERLQAGLD